VEALNESFNILADTKREAKVVKGLCTGQISNNDPVVTDDDRQAQTRLPADFYRPSGDK
jgi:hypothetical protein